MSRPNSADISLQGAFTATEVESQLQKILLSSIFRGSRRDSSFLEFIVRKALTGEVDNLKEYLIGLEVFGRKADFDPGTDPVVRSQARRLRTRLEKYYSTIGRTDPIHIEIPKGTYVPLFLRNGVVAESSVAEGADGPGSSDKAVVAEEGAALHTTSPTMRWIVALAVVAAVIAIAAGFYVVRSRRAKALAALADKPIILADFTNTTGDPLFDDTLRQAIASQLEQSPYLNLLSDAGIRQTLALMAQPKDLRLTRELSREVCVRAGGAAVVEGSIALQGGRYPIVLKAVDCQGGTAFAEVNVTANSRERVLPLVGQAATALRRRLGESLASIQQYDSPPEMVTTSSLEALQAYTLAMRAKNMWGDFATAAPLLQRAVALDPNFAYAYAQLGTVSYLTGQPQVAASYLRKAYELRERASLRERFYIDSHYHHLVTGDLEAAQKVYKKWLETYPQSEGVNGNLGAIYGELGQHEKALHFFQQELSISPSTGIPYANLVLGYLEMNRLDEAESTAQEAKARNLDIPTLHLCLYFIAFMRGDTAAMEQEVAHLSVQPGWESRILWEEANTAAYGGQLRKFQELVQRAAEAKIRDNNPEDAAGYYARAAVVQTLAGNVSAATRSLNTAQSLSFKHNGVNEAMALALTGNSARAAHMAEALDKASPQDTLTQFTHLPAIRTAIALNAGDIPGALTALTPAVPYEYSDEEYLSLLGPYLRGRAYLLERQGEAAAREFQKIMDHPGLCANDLVCALSRLQLARAYAIAGDNQRARNSCQDFFVLWKDADPDVPILRQAKAECARLQ